MIRLYVDSREVPVPDAPTSWEQLIRHVESAHLPSGAGIRQIEMDGSSLSVDELLLLPFEGIARSPLTSTIRLHTDDIRQLAAQAAGEALSYLERVGPVIPSLASNLRGTASPAARRGLRDLYEGLVWITLLLERLQGFLQASAPDLAAGNRDVHDQCTHLTSVLHLLIDSRLQGSLTRAADLLECELAPSLDECREILAHFRARLGSARQCSPIPQGAHPQA
jgi:hypothetical protein